MAEKRCQTVRKLNPDFVPGDDEQWAWIMEYPLHFPGILHGDRICCASVIQKYPQNHDHEKNDSGKAYGGPGHYSAGNMIDPYSPIHKLPDAAGQPEKDLDYRILYSITRQARKEGDLNPGLLHIALTINLYEWAGIRRENMQLSGIVHGDSISAVLSEEAFWKKFGRSNPDLDLIRKLKRHGVEIFACGQTFLNQGFQRQDMNPDITCALSALSVLSTCQLKGYALMTY